MKKGFTLIELLAVIVILAIIALIATPIILNIISDSKEESNKRSVELYGKAVEQAIAKSQLNGNEIPAGDYTSSSDGTTLTKGETELTVEYNGNVSCTTNKLYEDGSIYLAGCNGEYTYGIQKIEIGKMSSVCTPVEVATQGIYTSGDKYECKVDPNKEAYIFYVLSSTNDSVNLIMDRNINYDGSVSDVGIKQSEDAEKYNLVAWNSKTYNSEGPITAMNFLAEATKNWTNLTPMTYIYDETTENPGDYGYNKLEIINGEGKIYAKNVTEGAVITLKDGSASTLKARMVTIGEINTIKTNNGNTMPKWLYENLDQKKPEGYWTLSSGSSGRDPVFAWHVLHFGFAYYDYCGSAGNDYSIGVRPVITLSI